MKIYKIKLVKKEKIARNTLAFFFTKPSNFKFKAGQCVDLSLIHPDQTDDDGDQRSFSIASAPYEDKLIIETRMRNTAFKRVLNKAKIGYRVKMEGPFGSFILHNNSAIPAIFLAGGIGITPFMSIILQAEKDKLKHKIFLFYSNRTPTDAPNLKEFNNLEMKNRNFKFIPTMTQLKSLKSWKEEKGHITKKMLDYYMKDLKGIYYIAGSPAMVAGIHSILNKIGINDDNIRLEDFTGY